MAEIESKVAVVLDESQIALNAGSSQEVNVGDMVSLWRVVEVTDPDTDEVLGSVKLEKLRLVIEDVQEFLSVARIPATSVDFSNMSVFSSGRGKRIVGYGQVEDSKSVRVLPGDLATIYSGQEEEQLP